MSTEAILQNRIGIEPVSVGEDSNTAQLFTVFDLASTTKLILTSGEL